MYVGHVYQYYLHHRLQVTDLIRELQRFPQNAALFVPRLRRYVCACTPQLRRAKNDVNMIESSVSMPFGSAGMTSV
jgi:hypothetical protein